MNSNFHCHFYTVLLILLSSVYFLLQQLYCPAASSNASSCHFNHSPYFFIPYFALIMMSFLLFSESCWVVQQTYCFFWYALLLCYNSLLSNCNRTATCHTSDSKKHCIGCTLNIVLFCLVVGWGKVCEDEGGHHCHHPAFVIYSLYHLNSVNAVWIHARNNT